MNITFALNDYGRMKHLLEIAHIFKEEKALNNERDQSQDEQERSKIEEKLRDIEKKKRGEIEEYEKTQSQKQICLVAFAQF